MLVFLFQRIRRAMLFENYLKNGTVRKGFADIERAIKLIKDGEKRIHDIELIDINKVPKFVFENVYDAIRDFCDALLAKDGFKSYSHEASISYLKKYALDDSVVLALDRFRYKRNGSKYYGQIISEEEAKEIFEFYKKIKNKIEEILKSEKLI